MITNQKLKKHTQLYEQLLDIQEKMSENISIAKERGGNNELEVTRKVPSQKFIDKLKKKLLNKETLVEKTVGVKEKHLWEEVRILGVNGNQASEALKKKYPIIWELYEEEQKLVAEIEEQEKAVFGFNRKEMTLPNIIKLIKELIKLELKNEK